MSLADVAEGSRRRCACGRPSSAPFDASVPFIRGARQLSVRACVNHMPNAGSKVELERSSVLREDSAIDEDPQPAVSPSPPAHGKLAFDDELLLAHFKRPPEHVSPVLTEPLFEDRPFEQPYVVAARGASLTCHSVQPIIDVYGRDAGPCDPYAAYQDPSRSQDWPYGVDYTRTDTVHWR